MATNSAKQHIPVRVCLDLDSLEIPALWIDEKGFAVEASPVAEGADVAARLIFGGALHLTVPVRADGPTPTGQAFKFIEMPGMVHRLLRILLGVPDAATGVCRAVAGVTASVGVTS